MAPATLLTLPAEIQLNIIDLLPYPTAQVLAAVHPHFQNIIDLDTIRTATHSAEVFKQLTIAQREPFRKCQDHRACCGCLRLRPATKFSPRKRNDSCYYLVDWFCIDCSVKRSRVPNIWCEKCRGLGYADPLRHWGDIRRVEKLEVEFFWRWRTTPSYDIETGEFRHMWCFRYHKGDHRNCLSELGFDEI